MNKALELIAAGGAVLAFDANALCGFRRLGKLCEVVNQLRQAPVSLDIHLYVPALAHAEVLFDIRQDMGPAFHAKRVVQGLIDLGLVIQPFEERHAERAAEWLGEAYPSTEAWYAAKKQRFIKSLGLDEKKTASNVTGKKCAATVDFYIAAHAAQEGWILVTDDGGPDFEKIERKIDLSSLEQCLRGMLGRG